MSKPPSVLSELLRELFQELRTPRAAGSVLAYPAIRNFVLDVLEAGARKKTITRVATAELAVTIEPRLQVLGLEAVPARRKHVRVKSVDELLVTLREAEKVP